MVPISPTPENFNWDSCFLAPLQQCQRFAFVGDTDCGASVSDLNCSRCPSAVFGFIVSVVVNTVKFESIRAITHVLKECFEAIAPSFTHRDASAAVSAIVGSFRVKASGFSMTPRSVFTRPSHTVGLVLAVI